MRHALSGEIKLAGFRVHQIWGGPVHFPPNPSLPIIINRAMTMLPVLLAVSVLLGNGQSTPPAPVAPTRELVVGILIQPPFVEKISPTIYTGFAIDMWEEMAELTETHFTYREYSSAQDILKAVSESSIDVAVGDLTVTGARLKNMEFCQPYYLGGLRIMVNEDRTTSFVRLFDGLHSTGNLEIAGYAFIGMVVATLVVTMTLRRLDPLFSRNWHSGLAESFYHVVSVAMTGKTSYKGATGAGAKIMAAVWIVCGVAIVAYITSSVTSVMTANRMRDEISGPGDLGGKSIGVITGTPSADFARAQGWETQGFNSLSATVDALVEHEIQAIVYDAPVLAYYDRAHPELPLTEVGPMFDLQRYAFALPHGSPYRIPFNIAMLNLEESKFVEKLRARYFGIK